MKPFEFTETHLQVQWQLNVPNRDEITLALLSKIMTKYRKQLYDLSDQFCNVYPETAFKKFKTTSSFRTELTLCFLCCFAAGQSSSLKMISLFETLRIVFFLPK